MRDSQCASEILNNPLFVKLSMDIKHQLYEEWVSSDNQKEREDIHIRMTALVELVDLLTEKLNEN